MFAAATRRCAPVPPFASEPPSRQSGSVDWRELPDHIIEQITAYLTPSDLCALHRIAHRFHEALRTQIFRVRLATEIGRATKPSALRTAILGMHGGSLSVSDRVIMLEALATKIGHIGSVGQQPPLVDALLDAIGLLPPSHRAGPLDSLMRGLGGPSLAGASDRSHADRLWNAVLALPSGPRTQLLDRCLGYPVFHRVCLENVPGYDSLPAWIAQAQSRPLEERGVLLTMAARRYPVGRASLGDERVQYLLQACDSLRTPAGAPAAQQCHLLLELAQQLWQAPVVGKAAPIDEREALWLTLLDRAVRLPPDAAFAVLCFFARHMEDALVDTGRRWETLWELTTALRTAPGVRARWLAVMADAIRHYPDDTAWQRIAAAAWGLPDAELAAVFAALGNVLPCFPAEHGCALWRRLYDHIAQGLSPQSRPEPLATLVAALQLDEASPVQDIEARWQRLREALIPLEPSGRIRVLSEMMVDQPSVTALWQDYRRELANLGAEPLAAALHMLADKVPLLSPGDAARAAWRDIAAQVYRLPRQWLARPWTALMRSLPSVFPSPQAVDELAMLADMLGRQPLDARQCALLGGLEAAVGNVDLAVWLLHQARRLPPIGRAQVVARILWRMDLTGQQPARARACYQQVLEAVRWLPHRFRGAALAPMWTLRSRLMPVLTVDQRLAVHRHSERLLQGMPLDDLPPGGQPPRPHGERAMVRRAVRRARKRAAVR